MPYAHMHSNNEGKLYLAHHRNGGQGAPLVLLHGAGGSHLLWPPLLRRLPGTVVHALDLPGHGRSDGPVPEKLEDHASRVMEFLATLSEGPARLLGCSMGGAIALLCAISRPSLVGALILVSTGATLPTPPALLAAAGQNTGSWVDGFLDHIFGPDASPALQKTTRTQLLQEDPAILKRDLVACGRFDVSGRLGEIDVPTLVLCGSDDRMTPPSHSLLLAQGISHSRLQIVEGAGHMLILERPQAVARAVASFLQSLPDGERISLPANQGRAAS